MALFRQLLGRLHSGDVVLADRYFCSYFMICLLRERNVDVVTRLHQSRTADFRRGKPPTFGMALAGPCSGGSTPRGIGELRSKDKCVRDWW